MPPQSPTLVRNWRNILFLTLTPLAALASIAYYVLYSPVRTPTIILAIVMAVMVGTAITAGYHRYFSHQTYQAHWVVRLYWLLFGAAAFENSVKWWCADHRVHHQHTDHELDPYNIQKGFWHAHIGWIFYKPVPEPDFVNVADLLADPLVRWQDRYYALIATVMGFGFPALVATAWGDPLGGLLLGGFVRTVFNHHTTFAINSVCHWIGSKPYSNKHSARDSWLVALLTFGEGYHNFHHTFPGDYRNGIRSWHFDPAKWSIWLLAKLRLAWNLQRIPEERIFIAKLRRQEQRAAERLAKQPHLWLQPDLLVNCRKQVEQAYATWQALRTQYRALRRTKIDQMHENIQTWTAQLADLRSRAQQARREFRIAFAQWALTLKCAHA